MEIFLVEGVVDIFFEVEAEFFFGEMHFAGGFGGDLGDLGQAEVAGGLEVGDEIGGDGVVGERIVACGPDGQDCGLFG